MDFHCKDDFFFLNICFMFHRRKKIMHILELNFFLLFNASTDN